MIKPKALYAFSVICSLFFCAVAYFNNAATESTNLSKKIIETHKELIFTYHNILFDQTTEVKNLIHAFDEKKIDPISFDASFILYNLLSISSVEENQLISVSNKRAAAKIPLSFLSDLNSQLFITNEKSDSFLGYTQIVSLPFQKKQKTLVELFMLRKSLLADYKKVFKFDYTILARDKNNQWHFILSSIEAPLSQELLSSLKNELEVKLAKHITFFNHTLDSFDTTLDGKKTGVIPVGLHPSAGKEQLVLYTLPYPQNATKLRQQLLILGVFVLSFLISSAAYFISTSATVKS